MIGIGGKKRSKQNMHERNIRNHIFKVAKKNWLHEKFLEIEEKDLETNKTPKESEENIRVYMQEWKIPELDIYKESQ